MAATVAATTLLRLLENIVQTPVRWAIDLRYCRPCSKCPGKSPEGGREVVQRQLKAKASANGPQGYAKATGAVDPLFHRGINQRRTGRPGTGSHPRQDGRYCGSWHAADLTLS